MGGPRALAARHVTPPNLQHAVRDERLAHDAEEARLPWVRRHERQARRHGRKRQPPAAQLAALADTMATNARQRHAVSVL